MSVNGKRLMPTNRCGYVRHLLKDGKAKIVSRHPFTIQLLYESEEYTQPLEIGVDSGYIHVGVSVKSERREFFSAQFDLLTDEKSRHDDCREYRRTRRNRLRYRKCRFAKDTKPEGWIAPSLRHKAEAQVRIVENICKDFVSCLNSISISTDSTLPFGYFLTVEHTQILFRVSSFTSIRAVASQIFP